MKVEETFVVKAPIEKVWEFMSNPATMGPCVPGFVSAEEVEPDVYDTVMKVKVGIISLKMFARLRVVEKTAPTHLKSVGDGHDRLKAGTFHQEGTVDLEARGDDETQVKYGVNVRVVGKLATFGEKMMRATANKMGAKLAENVKKHLEKGECTVARIALGGVASVPMRAEETENSSWEPTSRERP